MRSMKVFLLYANRTASSVSNGSATKNCCPSKTSTGNVTRQPCATQASRKVLVCASALFCICEKKMQVQYVREGKSFEL